MPRPNSLHARLSRQDRVTLAHYCTVMPRSTWTNPRSVAQILLYLCPAQILPWRQLRSLHLKKTPPVPTQAISAGPARFSFEALQTSARQHCRARRIRRLINLVRRQSRRCPPAPGPDGVPINHLITKSNDDPSTTSVPHATALWPVPSVHPLPNLTRPRSMAKLALRPAADPGRRAHGVACPCWTICLPPVSKALIVCNSPRF